MGRSIYICFPGGAAYIHIPLRTKGGQYMCESHLSLYMWIYMQGLYELGCVESLDGLFVRHGRGGQKFFARRLSPSLFGHLCVCVCVCVCVHGHVWAFTYIHYEYVYIQIYMQQLSPSLFGHLCVRAWREQCVYLLWIFANIYMHTTPLTLAVRPTVCTRRRMSIHIFKCV